MKKYLFLAVLSSLTLAMGCSDSSESMSFGGGGHGSGSKPCKGDDCDKTPGTPGEPSGCEGENCQSGEGNNGSGTGSSTGGNENDKGERCKNIDLMTSAENCGECGFSCEGGKCVNGKCECADGWLDCDGNGSCESKGACNCEKGSTVECYDGDPSTMNVGDCRAGISTCDGVLWSDCVGQVLPRINVCTANPDGDADCNGVKDIEQDEDKDGYAICDGKSTKRYDCCDRGSDCNTSNPELVFPGEDKIDCKGNGIDDDCDGEIDEDDINCDGSSSSSTSTTSCLMTNRSCSEEGDYDPNAFWGGAHMQINAKLYAMALAKAMDMCMDFDVTAASASSMGGIIEYSVTQADMDQSDVNTMQINVVPGMYPAGSTGKAILPRTGKTFAVLSSGLAIDAKHGVHNDQLVGNMGMIPEPYRSANKNRLQTHQNCQTSSSIYDTVHLHFKMKAPDTAKGFSFDFRFLTQEYPQYVCTSFNDFFLAILTDEFGNPLPGVKPDGNISFDELGNPISVNNAFFTTCASISCDGYFGCPNNLTCSNTVCNSCPDGFDELYAYSMNPYTGGIYQSQKAGGTAWLTTTAPVTPGQVFNLDFYIWDTGDPIFDSTVLLDNFQWSCDETTVSTGFAQSGNPSGGVN